MLEKLKVLTRGPFKRGPIHVCMGDTMNLSYTRDGVRRTVLSQPVTRAGTYDEGVIFEAEEDGRHVLGGYFVEQKP